jgi:hypothetical protein
MICSERWPSNSLRWLLPRVAALRLLMSSPQCAGWIDTMALKRRRFSAREEDRNPEVTLAAFKADPLQNIRAAQPQVIVCAVHDGRHGETDTC